jgi:hypothetical protein
MRGTVAQKELTVQLQMPIVAPLRNADSQKAGDVSFSKFPLYPSFLTIYYPYPDSHSNDVSVKCYT